MYAIRSYYVQVWTSPKSGPPGSCGAGGDGCGRGARAVQERLEAVESRAGMETSMKVGFTERLNPNLELGLYSIAREAMNNILKHSQATKVAITLNKEDKKVILEICDNGVITSYSIHYTKLYDVFSKWNKKILAVQSNRIR